jgi:hypothetical protein
MYSCPRYVRLEEPGYTPKLKPSGLPQRAVLSTTLLSLYLFDMPRPPYTHLTLYAEDTVLLSQSWRPDIISRTLSHAVTTLLKYFTKWKLRLNAHKTESIIFSKRQRPLPKPLQIHDNVSWAFAVHNFSLVLDSKLLYTKQLHTVIKKVTGFLCPIFPLLVRDSSLTQSNKLTLYKLLIRFVLTYVGRVCRSTCPSNYLKLQVIQSKHLRVIGSYHRRISTSHLHDILNTEPIPTPGPTSRE